jgi:predicted SnoaL-like aldol condensation-catalyzing enzyme
MNSKEAKENERQLFEHVNNRDWEAVDRWVDEHIAEDYINHSTAFNETPDREGIKQMFRKGVELFPDMQLEIAEMVFEDDAMCFKFYTRQLGGGIGDITGLCMIKFTDDKITERWAYSDVPK